MKVHLYPSLKFPCYFFFFLFEELISMLTKEPTSPQLFVICEKGKGIPYIGYIFLLRDPLVVRERRHIPDVGYIFS